jgi:hypothetical protein
MLILIAITKLEEQMFEGSKTIFFFSYWVAIYIYIYIYIYLFISQIPLLVLSWVYYSADVCAEKKFN